MNLITGEELIDFAKTIKTKSEFEYFLKCLVADYTRNRDEWENSDLQSYLEGLNNFVPSMDGYYENVGEDVDVETASWRIVAESLIAASVYGN